MSILDTLKDMLSLMPHYRTVEAVKLLAAAADYAAEDVLSESATAGTVFKFDNMARHAGGSGEIRKVIAFCSVTALTPRITLYLFNQLPTSVLNDNVANTAPSLADNPSFEGQIDLPALEDLGGGSSITATPNTTGNLPLSYQCVDRSLYAIAVTRDAITSEAVGMTLRFKMLIKQD